MPDKPRIPERQSAEELALWLQRELERRSLTQAAAAAHARVAPTTIHNILHKDHIPKVETLFRLADGLEVSREMVLRLAGYLPQSSPQENRPSEQIRGPLVQELLDEFRKLPEEWKPIVLNQVETFVRLANLPSVHIVGEVTTAEEDAGGKEVDPDAQVQEDETAQAA
jgi:transcriptional regulator with XRE-family HTH domain